nr:uncharacterized protein LOC125180721 [Anser cygnoides]
MDPSPPCSVRPRGLSGAGGSEQGTRWHFPAPCSWGASEHRQRCWDVSVRGSASLPASRSGSAPEWHQLRVPRRGEDRGQPRDLPAKCRPSGLAPVQPLGMEGSWSLLRGAQSRQGHLAISHPSPSPRASFRGLIRTGVWSLGPWHPVGTPLGTARWWQSLPPCSHLTHVYRLTYYPCPSAPRFLRSPRFGGAAVCVVAGQGRLLAPAPAGFVLLHITRATYLGFGGVGWGEALRVGGLVSVFGVHFSVSLCGCSAQCKARCSPCRCLGHVAPPRARSWGVKPWLGSTHPASVWVPRSKPGPKPPAEPGSGWAVREGK